MSLKSFLGVAILFGLVFLAVFTFGCAEQNGAKNLAPTQTTKETIKKETQKVVKPEKTKNELITNISNTYDMQIKEAENILFEMGFSYNSSKISMWDSKIDGILKKANSTEDPEIRKNLLIEVVTLKYYKLQNLRSLVAIAEIEKEYWKSASSGEDIKEFYSQDGDLFYGSGIKVKRVDITQMVEKMNAVNGMTLQSLEIYHFGTGSNLVFIREGGRTIGAGQVTAKIGVPENGILIEPLDLKNAPALRGIAIQTAGEDEPSLLSERPRNPQTGKEIFVISPNEKGIYEIQHVNVSTIVSPERGNPCFRINNYSTICSSPIVATFILVPSKKPSFELLSPDEMYLMPGNYTVTTFVMKADLKQLAEQLVNINARISGGKVSVDSPTRAFDAFQRTDTKTVTVDFRTHYKTNLSSLFGVLSKRTPTIPAFKDVPTPENIGNLTETTNFSMKLYVISNTNGDVLIVPQIQGVSKIALDFADRMFVEVVNFKNPSTGEELKVISFKILDVDGKVDVRASQIAKVNNVIIAVHSDENLDKK